MSKRTQQPKTPFFENFESLCSEKGLSVSKAAEEFGFTRSAVSSWRKGGLPRKKTLEELAKKLGVTPQYLMYNTGEKSEPIIEQEPIVEDGLHTTPTDKWSGSTTDFDMLREGDNKIISIAPKQFEHSEWREFIEIAFALLKFYYPTETEEFLAHKLNMPSAITNTLRNDNIRRITIGSDWNSKFFSLFDYQSIDHIVTSLIKLSRILQEELDKFFYEKMHKTISNCLYEDNISAFKYVDEKVWYLPVIGYEFYTFIKLNDEDRYWFLACRDLLCIPTSNGMAFIHKAVTLAYGDGYNVERFYIAFTSRNNSTGGEAAFQVELIKNKLQACMDELPFIPSNIQVHLLHLHGETREIIDTKLLELCRTD